MTPREYQMEMVEAVLEYIQTKPGNPVVASPTGTGKCFGRGTSLLMFDGTHKAVENVEVGDLLMGPDSTPRKVESLARGSEALYRVVPVKGEGYVVNESHILSLKVTGGSKGYGEKDKLVNISVSDYLKCSKSKRHILKGWKPDIIHYATKTVDVPPYIMGLWLGDGHSWTTAITCADDELAQEWIAYGNTLKHHRLRVVTPDNHVFTYFIARHRGYRNIFMTALRKYGLLFDKHIPLDYITGDESQRLELLAGLLDSDGHLTCGGFDFISKFWHLASTMCQLCHSLGLAAYVKACFKSAQSGNVGIYYRVSISGDCSRIPTRLKRKQAEPRRQVKSVLRTGITLVPLGVGEYFGFTVSGPDRLFLLSDFTVVHNTMAFNVLLKELVTRWPGLKILCVAHVKEIIAQNASSMIRYWPEAPIGIYSAGLKQYDTRQDIIFSSIQSVAKKAEIFGEVHIVLIDEAHMVSPKEGSLYDKFIKALKVTYPQLRVIGFSATPYRLGQGLLTEGELFSDICIDLTTTERFNQFVKEGHLCRLITKGTEATVDVSQVHIRNGDFAEDEVQALFDTDDMNRAVVKECIRWGGNRKHWLGFAAGIAHAENLAREFLAHGIATTVVDGKLSMEERDKRIGDFKAGVYRCCLNVGVLTTGFDMPHLDLGFVARATQSTGLWIQMLGRFIRTAPDKTTATILDFASNIRRCGPVNAPIIPRPKKKGEGSGEAPVKLCPNCGSYCHTRVTICPDCEYAFPPSSCLEKSASTMQVMVDADETPVFEDCNVYSVVFRKHISKTGTECVRVAYQVGASSASEYLVCRDDDFFRRKMEVWWKHRKGNKPAPVNADEFLRRTGELVSPVSVRLITNKRHPEVVGATMPEMP